MSFKRTWQAIAILPCFLPFPALAQSTSAIPQLEQVVVTPSRAAELQNAVLGDVTVIDKTELQRTGQSSLAETLSRHPGLEFASSGGPQTLTSVFMRGTNPQQTLVLVDGVRINSIISGSVNWNAIDPATVERVEIVRGAASSLYGSDAIGGVINIITRKSGEDRPLAAWANVGYGTYDTFKSSVGFSGARDGWDYSLSSSLAESSGFNATRPEEPFGAFNRDADGYSQRSLAATLGYRWRAGHHIGISAYNGYTNGDYDNGPTDHPTYTLTRQQIYSITSTDDITANWQSVLRFGFSSENVDSRSFDPFDNEFGSDTFRTQQRSYSWQNNVKLAPDHRISLILERLEERPSGSSDYTVNRRNTNAAGLVYRGDFGAHHVQASVRNDNISGHGNQVTGGLAYDLDLNDQWRVGVAGSTGFRAPTFADLYFPMQFGYVGNPDLQPEKSRSVEASVRYATEDTRLSLVAYQNKIRNLISPFVCIEQGPFFCNLGHPENVASATLRGVTLAAEQDYGHTTLRASADFTNPRDDRSGRQLARRARQTYRFSVEHRIQAVKVGAEYQFTGKRYDDEANQTTLGGHSLLNLTAAYDFSPNVGVQIRWNNVLDKQYSTVYGYNMPGSNVFVNLSLRM
jgi:vitamin B12 transporter